MIDEDEYTILVGNRFSLTCEMNGHEQDVTFEKIGEDNLSGDVWQNGNELRFDYVQLENRGIYQCKTESNGQMIKASVIIDVFGKKISNIYELITRMKNDFFYILYFLQFLQKQRLKSIHLNHKWCKMENLYCSNVEWLLHIYY